jgi:hypothetical protein
MLQEFCMDITKVNRDIACVAMVVRTLMLAISVYNVLSIF